MTFEHTKEYQQKILVNLLNDENFINKIITIIKPEYFEFESHQWILKCIKLYYNKYHKIITKDALGVLISKIEQKHIREDVLKEAYLIHLNAKKLMDDYEFVQETSLSFCSEMDFKNAMIKASEYVSNGDLDSAFFLLQESYHKKSVGDDGVDIDDVEHRKQTQERSNICKLPWENLNKRMGGGLASGEMMALIAPMGVGKTHVAVNVASYCKQNNMNCILFSLEMKEEYNRHRIDSILLDRNSKELNYDEKHIEDIDVVLKKYKGKVIIKKYIANSVTAETIRSFIRRKKSQGLKIDFVVIDYVDIMESTNPAFNNLKDWEKLEKISRELDVVADEENIRLVALMQGNTQSIGLKVITARNTGGGAKRLHPFDAIFGFAKSEEDKVNNTGTWSFIKNRFGFDGFYLPVITDYSKSFIDILDDEQVEDSAPSQNSNTNNNGNTLAKRYDKFVQKKLGSENNNLEDGDTF